MHTDGLDGRELVKGVAASFAVLAGFLLLLGVLGDLFVFDGSIARAELDALGWVADHRSGPIDSLARIGSSLTDTWTVLGLVTGATVVLWAAGHLRQALLLPFGLALGVRHVPPGLDDHRPCPPGRDAARLGAVHVELPVRPRRRRGGRLRRARRDRRLVPARPVASGGELRRRRDRRLRRRRRGCTRACTIRATSSPASSWVRVRCSPLPTARASRRSRFARRTERGLERRPEEVRSR